MNVADVRSALAGQLASTGLRAHATVPDSVTPPALVVVPTAGVLVDFDGGELVTFAVFVLASRADARSGQVDLDAYLAATGTKSLRLALESDPTLDGTVGDARWAGWEGYGAQFTFAGVEYVGVQVNIETTG